MKSRTPLCPLPLTLFALLGLAAGAPAADACTTFQFHEGSAIVGKSYDWSQGQALVLVNKKDVQKRSLAAKPGDRPIEWVSRHASLTFNQYGREFPNGGMNTAGLVVEIMWLRESSYPPVDERPTLNELQWIQYQLDRFSTVAEVVDHAPKTRVSSVYAPVHYLACDKGGACAAIEYVDGKLTVTSGPRLIAKALTNSTYADSKRYLEGFDGFGGAIKRVPDDLGSRTRFARAAQACRGQAAGWKEAFDILDSVRQGDYTKWQIVYDPAALKVRFRTTAQKALKVVDLGRFDAGCAAPVLMLDIDHADPGDATSRFVPYTLSANRSLLKTGLASLRGLPPGAAELLALFPSGLRCSAP